MDPALKAIRDLLVGDSHEATILAGSTASQLVVSSGDAATFQPGDRVHVTGAGASLGNNDLWTTLDDVDVTNGLLDLDPVLPAAPVATVDAVRNGVVECVVDGTAVEFHKHPEADQLERAANNPPRCAIILRPGPNPPGAFEVERPVYDIIMAGVEPDFVRGLKARVRFLFDGDRGTLAVAGHELDELYITLDDRGVERPDTKLMEWVIRVGLKMVPVEATP